MQMTIARQVSAFLQQATDLQPPNDVTVVFTGLALVFLILVLITLILTLSGKFFASLDAKKKNVQQSKTSAPAPTVATQPAKPAVQAAPAPVIQTGIPPEVIAAISAAVASIEDGKYVLETVQLTKTAPKGNGRASNRWNLAGVIANTEPF